MKMMEVVMTMKVMTMMEMVMTMMSKVEWGFSHLLVCTNLAATEVAAGALYCGLGKFGKMKQPQVAFFWAFYLSISDDDDDKRERKW